MGLKALLSRTYDSFEDRIDSLKHPILTIFIIGLVLRLLLLPLTNVDSWGWYRTGELIVSGDGFYARSGYYYGPLFGYIISVALIPGTLLFGTGVFSLPSEAMVQIQPYFDFNPALQTIGFLAMFKIMMIVGDVLAAFLVRWMINHFTGDMKKANAGFALVFLSPIILVESSIHGMFDIYCGILALLSIYFVLKGRYVLAGISWTSATLMKIFPAYLFPVLIAFIIKRNGGQIKSSVIDITKAGIASVTTMLLLYLPQIMNGTFADTWSYLFNRASNAKNILGSITSHLWIIIPAIILLIVILYVLKKKVLPSYKPKPLTARKSIAIMSGMALAVFAGLVIVNGGIDKMFANLFHSSYLVGIAIQGIALIVAFILGYKLYWSDAKDEGKLLLMVGTLAIATCFLWVPMPEYLILILPLIAVYAMTYDKRYITPFLFISIGATIFIILVEGPAALFVSVAQYTDLVDMSLIMNLVEAYVSGPGLGEYSIYQLVFCIIGAATQLIGVIMLFVYRFNPYGLEEKAI